MSFLNTNKIGYHYFNAKNSFMSKVSEEKLKELRESIRSTIDWGAYSKWIAEGEPYEEHEEVLLFLNQKKHESEIAYSKPDGTRRHNPDRGRGYYNGRTSNRGSRKTDQKTRKASNHITPTKGAKTTTRNNGQHCSKVPRSNEVSNPTKIHNKNAK
ncbi:hypothetical protein RhiirA5_373678 [Rhizophagus irregularis]|uniref:Uncharacterized protein n=2 Tax=Rhizophagus irregularis TaxID=588596 RepID=A0A2I1HNU2_9GLOM|nr:hypothetical protein GLOIN_2v1479401 [Rhizophagus irregularis DAOM 181602=DAOM 197198]PKC11694.1 hypothetical protein RhiirA5_373678 [Rhizophagus irregularis]PKC61877.1 hypothetical protein RhiirA1_398073 [Rhizophagus irregularis]PKY60142.1 hypothetical protein RhiirA4_430905 [Rhizophagus irregularis]PKY60551.1 hypothetical protein RhiirA4_431214 [Rhizophagus irregularis]POG70202.1 hypothetical protein GLOIN_2v1479401 [Rhizophagus irregularis DAOM 181602=DAOM 197198]|eukprot:XP_025177068.1 hypothetical protein GLOIN_2v1479401 [Rhizophagus irregularis DAOM 181602=DAOM 197198]